MRGKSRKISFLAEDLPRKGGVRKSFQGVMYVFPMYTDSDSAVGWASVSGAVEARTSARELRGRRMGG